MAATWPGCSLLIITILCLAHAGPTVRLRLEGPDPGFVVESDSSGSGCLFRGQRRAPGDTWTTAGDQGCAEFSCEDGGVLTTTWCGNFWAGPSCRRVRGNWSAHYPDCCPKLFCS